MTEGVRYMFECIVRFPCPVCGDLSVHGAAAHYCCLVDAAQVF